MTNNILELGDMVLTAFVGPEGDASIQITIGDKYEKLTSNQALTLAHALLSRVMRMDGFEATS